MTKRLTPEQLSLLRTEPLTGPNKIALALRLLDLSQRQFALAVRMHFTHLNTVASKGADIRLSTARRIADALGAGLDDIFPSPTTNRRKGSDRRTARAAAKGTEQRSGTDRRGPKAELPEAA
jgi:transcriptional regulator with XRE-family HTH domain